MVGRFAHAQETQAKPRGLFCRAKGKKRRRGIHLSRENARNSAQGAPPPAGRDNSQVFWTWQAAPRRGALTVFAEKSHAWRRRCRARSDDVGLDDFPAETRRAVRLAQIAAALGVKRSMVNFGSFFPPSNQAAVTGDQNRSI